VSAQTQALETTSNTLWTTVSPDAIQDLPLNGRDALQFAELVVGVTNAGQERYTSVNAPPAAALNITVDGANDNFPHISILNSTCQSSDVGRHQY
jgi:hypothetical protein